MSWSAAAWSASSWAVWPPLPLPHTIVLDFGGVSLPVLELSELIRVEERAGRPKDLAALPVLRATWAEAERRRGRTT